METPILIPGLKESVIEACRKLSWESTRTLLLQWLKEDTVEYQQLINIPKDSSVICYACYNGYLELISLFVKNGFPVNYKIIDEVHTSYDDIRDYDNMLHVAAYGRQVPLIKYLVSVGADVNSCSDTMVTPLHSAFKATFLNRTYVENMCIPKVQNSLIDVIKCLLESGCNVNCKDIFGLSPVYYAVERCNIDVIKLLIDYGADVNIRCNFGRTPLLCSIESPSPRFEIVELLLNTGANINFRDTHNSTVLHFAMRTASQIVIELLLERGANVNSKNIFNHTPLYEYAFILNPIVDNVVNRFVGEDGINIVGTLIIWGADINIFDHQGRTLLHWAARQGSVHLVKLLIDRGLDIKDKIGKRPINYAADSGHHTVVQCFIDYYYSKMSL